MLMKSVSDFVEFLSLKSHTTNDILSNMVLRVLRPLDATSAFISQLNNRNEVENVGMYGFGEKIRPEYFYQHNLNGLHPITDAIKNRKIVWITSLPNWPIEYPELAKVKYESDEKTFICFPIEKCGTPVAILGFFCRPLIHPDAAIDSFLKTIGNVFGLYLNHDINEREVFPSKKIISTKNNPKIKYGELTERQKLILRMISEHRTNSNIGELLGYSASTIRQDTIKIFASLQCHGREEASKIYLEKFSHD